MSERGRFHGYSVQAVYDPHWPYEGGAEGIWSASPCVMPGLILTGATKEEALNKLSGAIGRFRDRIEELTGEPYPPDVPETMGEVVIESEWESNVQVNWQGFTDPTDSQ